MINQPPPPPPPPPGPQPPIPQRPPQGNRRVALAVIAAVALLLAGALAYSRTTASSGPADCSYDPDAINFFPDSNDGFGYCDDNLSSRYLCDNGRIMWLDTDNDRYGYEGGNWQPIPDTGVLPSSVRESCTR